MKITTQDYKDVTVAELHGEFTVDASSAFHDTISSVISQGPKGIVLDFSNVGSVDSKGLEQMLWLRDYCIDNNRQLKLAGLDENCAKILEITRLEDKFDNYAELAGAVKSFT